MAVVCCLMVADIVVGSCVLFVVLCLWFVAVLVVCWLLFVVSRDLSCLLLLICVVLRLCVVCVCCLMYDVFLRLLFG